MKCSKSTLCAALMFTAMSLDAVATPIEISQFSLFLSAPELAADSFQDDQLGYFDPVFAPSVNTFGDGGFDVQFSSSLDSDSYGTASWLITNNTGGTISTSRVMGFLDADLGLNDYWNEYGETVGDVAGQYGSWEIDEPGYYFGDIYDNLLDGELDNSNAFSCGCIEDVSLALGFDVVDWLAGETIVATFDIGRVLGSGQAGLAQFDADTEDSLYFSGSVQRVSSVPEPGSLMLFALGSLGLLIARKTKK